jgi:DNA topoisomerase-2
MKTVSAEHFINEFKDFPAYDNVRKIASVVDGLKNSSRKVIYYCLLTTINKPIKTSQFKAQVEQETHYLHGDITGVVETLAKDYCGANNINLLEPHGNFGTRLVKQASAPRYTFTKPSSDLYEIFDKEDLAILTKQYFEGDEIEPVYLMPNIPMLLVNGSEGISTGFAQKIYARDPKKLKQSIIKKLNGVKHTYKEGPWYRGFAGDICSTDQPNKYVIKGKCEVINSTTVEVTEIPFTYDLQQYVKVLDRLEDDGVIRSYQDYSEDDFKFTIKFSRSDLVDITNDELLTKLKLVKNISENYTVQDENNRIKVFETVDEIVDYFIDIRLKFLEKKIEYKTNKINSQLNVLNERKRFIEYVIDDKIVLAKQTKDKIVKQLESHEFELVDGSYDYLLNMNFMSLSTERINKLQKDIDELNNQLEYYKSSTPNSIYIDELK